MALDQGNNDTLSDNSLDSVLSSNDIFTILAEINANLQKIITTNTTVNKESFNTDNSDNVKVKTKVDTEFEDSFNTSSSDDDITKTISKTISGSLLLKIGHIGSNVSVCCPDCCKKEEKCKKEENDKKEENCKKDDYRRDDYRKNEEW